MSDRDTARASDRDTARRGWAPFAVLAVVFGVLLWSAVQDRLLFAVLASALLAVAAYRRWATHRFAPRPAERFARSAVAGAAGAMLPELSRDHWPASTLDRLAEAGPDRIILAAATLGRDRYPSRRPGRAVTWANRVVATVLGVTLGAALTWAASRPGCGWWLDPLVALPWPIWVALALALLGRALASGQHRMQTALVTAAMRSRPAEETAALLEPAHRERHAAVTAELNRLADHAEGRAAARPAPERQVVEALLAAGTVAGLAAGLLVAC